MSAPGTPGRAADASPRARWTLAVAAALAGLPLLKGPGEFWIDWTNHLWMAGYVGRHFRVHGSMPAFLNTHEVVGMAHPIFYGFLFYPLLGPLTAVISPDLVVRVLSVAALWVQGLMVWHAFERVAGSRIGTAIAVLVTWQIYPLTNLYNRAALTEFTGGILLTCALSAWLLLLTEPDRFRRACYLGLFVLLVVLTAGSHPISGLCGGLFLGLVALLTLRFVPVDRPLVLAGVASVGLGLVVLAPWAFVIARFRPLLHISAIRGNIVYFPRSIDAAWSRFSPLPVDRRTFETANLLDVSTPFLDAQLSVPLLVVGLAAAWAGWRASRGVERADWRLWTLAASAWALFLAAVWVSVSPRAGVPEFLRVIQFAYRLVTYQNLALLLATFFVLWLAPPAWNLGAGPVLRRACGAAVALAALALPVKLWHAVRIATHDPGIRLLSTDHRASTTLPARFYAQRDYTTPALYGGTEVAAAPGSPRVALRVEEGERFGEVAAGKVVLERPGRVYTNVSAFPWHQLLVDGVKIPPQQLVMVWQDGTLAFEATAGRHRVTVRSKVDPTWVALRKASWLALALWVTLLVGARFASRRRPAGALRAEG